MPYETSPGGDATARAILGGTPTTALEALLLYGFADTAPKVVRLRRAGHAVEARIVPLATVLARLEAALGAPVPASALARAEGKVVEYFVAAAPARAVAPAPKAAKADAWTLAVVKAGGPKALRAVRKATAKRLSSARWKRAGARWRAERAAKEGAA